MVTAAAALVMALSAVAPAPALAAITNGTTGQITIKKGDKVSFEVGDTVKLYRVVTATYDEKLNTVDYAWNADVVDTAKTPNFDDAWVGQSYTSTSAEVNQVRTALKQGAAETRQVIIDNDSVSNANGDGLQITGLPMGQYLLVVETEADSTRVFQNTIQSVLPTKAEGSTEWTAPAPVTVQLKGTTVTVDKKVDGKDNGTTNKGVGDTLGYTISAPVPNYPENVDKATVKFTFTDTMVKGLALKDKNGNGQFDAGDFTVTVDGAAVVASNFTVTDATATGFKIAFKADWLLANGGKTVTIAYDATITSDAVQENPLTNDVTLEFTRDPNNPSDFGTVTDEVKSVVYGFQFNKVDAKDSTKNLSGAQFDIYKDEAGKNKVGTTTESDEKGLVKFEGLAAGTYYLKEIKAPEGYQVRTDMIKFTIVDAATITKNPATGKVTITWKDGYSADRLQTPFMDGTSTTDPFWNKVKNVSDKEVVLPTTGGPGTIALTAGGVAIMGVAAFYLTRSRKEQK